MPSRPPLRHRKRFPSISPNECASACGAPSSKVARSGAGHWMSTVPRSSGIAIAGMTLTEVAEAHHISRALVSKIVLQGLPTAGHKG